jgi:hypothetical protein
MKKPFLTILLITFLMMATNGCGSVATGLSSSPPTAVPTTNTPIPPAPTATPSPTETLTLTPTAPAEPTSTLAPTATASGNRVTDWQIAQSGGFDSDMAHWDRRLGKLSHTTTELNTAPGAAYAVTDYSDGTGGYTAVFGQCIDLSSALNDWSAVDGQRNFTLEATLKTDGNIVFASASGFFFQDARCSNPLSGMSHIFPPSVQGNQNWTRVSATVALPNSARSIDVFFQVTGADHSGTVYIDDVLAYPSDFNGKTE